MISGTSNDSLRHFIGLRAQLPSQVYFTGQVEPVAQRSKRHWLHWICSLNTTFTTAVLRRLWVYASVYSIFVHFLFDRGSFYNIKSFSWSMIMFSVFGSPFGKKSLWLQPFLYLVGCYNVPVVFILLNCYTAMRLNCNGFWQARNIATRLFSIRKFFTP